MTKRSVIIFQKRFIFNNGHKPILTIHKQAPKYWWTFSNLEVKAITQSATKENTEELRGTQRKNFINYGMMSPLLKIAIFTK